MDKLLYGSAYYAEYLPYDRVDTDMAMMHAAHHNVVRIAESTWSTLEPQPGVFDFTQVDRALDAAEAAGISVIVGTPTYAVPAWLVASHPDVLAETASGPGRYGARQIMDITNPAYLFHAERVIRELLGHTARRGAVIGFQIDNETKHYGVASLDVQRAFVKHLRTRFDDDLVAMNAAFGLDYWSNRIDAWEDFPDVRGTINGSLAGAFESFRRGLVDEFLGWQAGIVREYARADQFITQNFDFDWAPGWSYGLQPSVNHFTAARAVSLAGTDIYHPTQSSLTGREIAFGGDMTRSIKGGENYLVLETQAQGQMGWLPFPGQLRLQAYSHLASGALGVMYWHWHSIHNSFETYWKGLLSHDFEPNPTYLESGVVGEEWDRHCASLVGLRKTNRVAVMVSNESLTALQWATIETGFPNGIFGTSISYNDVLRWVYDALFDLNVEVDFIPVDATDLHRYSMILTPALYTSPESMLNGLADFVRDGGHLVSTFRLGVADEHVKVWHDKAPHALTTTFGMTYNQFTKPDGARLKPCGALGNATSIVDSEALHLLELLRPAEGTQVLATYDHPAWGDYAAITRNAVGEGTATYLGTMTSPEALREVLELTLRGAGLWGWAQDLSSSTPTVRVRRGVNARGNEVTYLLNYSGSPVSLPSPVEGASVLSGGEWIRTGGDLRIEAWDLAILEG
ncbi:beta-galactosidase [Tessaracoccus bendigoensis DSM 12906]|uniref:beta-galactosidase n=1 Tax=Tessaracoccus bendigoensis DSM 12906 TaxID=1123357 RepID=A0A1M6H6Q4_9ACTN|nr:beta-galactosidase [Tessaracoccus bendigoensis]SHJ17846.1 beta-galactosidase [Tessaracoccus bendigoensis DSM 12906]